MGLFQKAYETYEAMKGRYCGQYIDGMCEALAPVSHCLTSSDIEITLDKTGKFCATRCVEKTEPKIIIPVTEASAIRTSGAASCPHGLCEQLKFFIAEKQNDKNENPYMEQLSQWCVSSQDHPKAHAVLSYLRTGSLLDDLDSVKLVNRDDQGNIRNEKDLIRWKVLDSSLGMPDECWKDMSLFQAWVNYYASLRKYEERICLVSGEKAPVAEMHPKTIVAKHGNAKLVSSNDTTNFTYRGRFTEAWQAAGMSYEVSQKAHAALRWVLANQGVLISKRSFVAWNPKGLEIPAVHSPLLRSKKPLIKASDYREELRKTLYGFQEKLPKDSSVVVAAFDAATSGRLALAYYNEFGAWDFLERLHHWDKSCCWFNRPFGIQSPDLRDIVHCAFGTLVEKNGVQEFKADDKILPQHVQRLLSCRLDRSLMPFDIVKALAEQVSRTYPLIDEKTQNRLLHTVCAAVYKYHLDRKEEYGMEVEENKNDLSYHYGRLLAVLEKAETDTYEKGEKRVANAIRLISVFAKRPQYTACLVWEQLKKAYWPQLPPPCRIYYDRLVGQIMARIGDWPENEQRAPLTPTYFLGYSLQRNVLYKSHGQSDNLEENDGNLAEKN